MSQVCFGCCLTGNGFKVCGQCLRVRYCSLECQKSSWPQHKRECAEVARAKLNSSAEGLAVDRAPQFADGYWVNALFYRTLEERRKTRSSFLFRNLQYLNPPVKPKLYLSCQDSLEVCHNRLNEKGCRKTLQKTLVVLVEKVVLFGEVSLHDMEASAFIHAFVCMNNSPPSLASSANGNGTPSTSPSFSPFFCKARAHTQIVKAEDRAELLLSATIRPHPFVFPENLSSFRASCHSPSSCSAFSSSCTPRNHEALQLSSLCPVATNGSHSGHKTQDTAQPERHSKDFVYLSFDLNFLEHKPGLQSLVVEIHLPRILAPGKRDAEEHSKNQKSPHALQWKVPLVSNNQFLLAGSRSVHSDRGVLHLHFGWRYSAKRDRTANSTTTATNSHIQRYRQPAPKPIQPPRVTFKYYVSKGMKGEREAVEIREGFRCPFCQKNLYTFHGLACHLETTHDRYSFRCVHDATREVHVQIKHPLDSPSSARNWAFVGGAELRAAVKASYTRFCGAEGKKVEAVTVQANEEVEDAEEGETKEHHYERDEAFESKGQDNDPTQCHALVAGSEPAKKKPKLVPSPLVARQFFHPNTLCPVRELEFDSDTDTDDSWKTFLHRRDLNEHDELSWSENTFMNLWNQYAHKKHPTLDDRFFADRCVAFAKEHGAQLLTQNLRSGFVSHLLTMWEFGMISADCFLSCMGELDSPETCSHAHAEKKVKRSAVQGERHWLALIARAQGIVQ